jgi:hypothetical protein
MISNGLTMWRLAQIKSPYAFNRSSKPRRFSKRMSQSAVFKSSPRATQFADDHQRVSNCSAFAANVDAFAFRSAAISSIKSLRRASTAVS